jgi:hypothetical protein
MEFDQARGTLADELRGNLCHWTRSYPDMRKQYEAALAEMEGATEREYPSGIVVICRGPHLLAQARDLRGTRPPAVTESY